MSQERRYQRIMDLDIYFLPQRQTALVAKQAAEIDILRGRSLCRGGRYGIILHQV
jgi:hypothetical protein